MPKPMPSTAKPDARHFRDCPRTEHIPDTAKRTRMTQPDIARKAPLFFSLLLEPAHGDKADEGQVGKKLLEAVADE